jgi:hypothetical protein
MACVLTAAEEAGEPLDAIVLKKAQPFSGLSHGLVGLEPRGELGPATLAHLGEPGPVYAFIGGANHLTLGLRQHPVPFDFVLPEEPDLHVDSQAQVVPFAALERIMAADARPHVSVLGAIAAAANGPVFQFEAPPPPTTDWLSAKGVSGRLPFRRRANAEVPGGAVGQLHAGYVRYKLWRLHSRLFKSVCADIGVQFVEHPPAAVDGDGFLRPTFCHNATHANSAYGALILEQMRQLDGVPVRASRAS